MTLWRGKLEYLILNQSYARELRVVGAVADRKTLSVAFELRSGFGRLQPKYERLKPTGRADQPP
jgi:hypothetical protein